MVISMWIFSKSIQKRKKSFCERCAWVEKIAVGYFSWVTDMSVYD